MPISFNQIPILLRTPGAYTEYDSSRALNIVAAVPTRVLMIGARRSTGTVAQHVLKNIRGKNDGADYFGRGSQLAHMIEAFRSVNQFTELWAIGVDVAGTAATGTISITGTATEAGALSFLIGGRAVPITVANGATGASLATLLAAELPSTSDLPVTGAVDGSVNTEVDVTSRHAAALSNDIDMRINYYTGESTPAGLTVTIVQLASGATDPSVATAIAALPDEWYTHIVSGFNGDANVDLLEAEAELRWGPLVQKDTAIFVGVDGGYSTQTTYGAARNSKYTAAIGDGASPTPPWIWASVAAAVDAFEPNPARQRTTLKLPGVLPPNREDLFIQSERNLLLQSGISTYTVDGSGTVYLERLITTYQTNGLGADDPTFLDLTTMHTLKALRYTLNNRIQTKYPRHMLADDGMVVPPGMPIVTPSVIKGEIIALYDQWADQGWVEGSPAAKKLFAESLVVERNASDVNRVDALIPPDLMNQFLVFAGQIQFLLNAA